MGMCHCLSSSAGEGWLTATWAEGLQGLSGSCFKNGSNSKGCNKPKLYTMPVGVTQSVSVHAT